VYFARGVCYERLKKWDLAEKDFMEALKLNPDQPDVLNYLGYSWIEMGKNVEEGIRMVTKAYELKPEDSHILDSVGWGWYKLGNYENALKFLEAAITQMPYDATVNDHLGDTYWRLGRMTEAKYQWRRALENNPEKKYIDPLKSKLERGLPDEVATPLQKTPMASQDVNLSIAPLEGEPEEMESLPKN
jgi:tetratricopeptide (TPR) repeat protein